MQVVKRWEKFPDGRTVCYWLRDGNGYCLLTNRCWSLKPCPKTQLQADKARAAIFGTTHLVQR